MLSLPRTIGVCLTFLTPMMAASVANTQDNGPVELATSVDIKASEGIAGVPAADKSTAGSAPGMDLYTWDLKGENHLINLVSAKRRGMIDKIYPTPKHLVLTIHDNFRGQIKKGGSVCSLIVLTKATGALTCIANVRLSDRIAEWANKPVVQTNAGGNRLIFSGLPGNGGGYEDTFFLDLAANPPKIRNLTGDSNAYEEDYAINDDSDVFIKSSGGSGGRSLKMVKNGGTLQAVGTAGNAEWTNCLTNGVGTNNNYFYAIGSGGTSSTNLIRVKKDGSQNFQMTSILTGQSEIDAFHCQVATKGQNFLGFFGEKEGKGWLFIYDDKEDNLTDTWATQEIPEMVTVLGATADAEHIFIYGEDALGSTTVQKYVIATNTFSTLVPHHKYVITDIRGPASGQLLIIGEQMSDSAYISAKVRVTDGAVTPVSIKFPAVRQLIPLN